MSDPISPSPRMFDRMPAPVVDDAVHAPVQGILKKVKEQIPAKPITTNAKLATTSKKPRAIQVEVIPDNEGEPLNVLPSDARSLLEPITVAPRPSAPPHAFNHIFDYDEPSASGAQTSSSQGSSSNKAGDSAAMNAKAASSGKNDKAKHVRWTPSVSGTNAGQAEGPSGADVRPVPGKQAPGRPPIRARASMPATGAEKQGAGQKHGDDLQRIAVEAIENLKQTRNKPPSAV
ncbi:uncharacterized protein SCHCODRAFT_02513673 [Schizophyllum commune H4-8]|uniref:Expressed protein n=1 Tax=Schizophyllum commune (strain H4-8 / FGSC 9210) TaxID=578458 RepID=D8QEJ8_SCHCM|nr:uncharacterized protein SCHCODRAFT_02513673 [Schizophyllum commune H4-8]KAI5888253.1 hypothetical protein SCHCODRAFT_02513673 [Schizophyllum commune H4-8]